MSTLYEIIETLDGEIVLRRAGEEEEPLVSIAFSNEALYFLEKKKLSVAKAMIEAGLTAASDDHIVRIEEMPLDDSSIETDVDNALEEKNINTIH